jgi:hypothetical protein
LDAWKKMVVEYLVVGNPSSTGKLLHFVQNSTHHHLEKNRKNVMSQYEFRYNIVMA